MSPFPHLRPARRARATAAATLAVCALLAGHSVAGAKPQAPNPHPPKPTVVSGVFGRRYCELLLIHPGSSGLTADVYNTYGLNTCPPRAWKAIDTAAVAKANHALLAVRNGPRYWLMNRIIKNWHGARVIKNLGGLRMIEQATVVVGSNTAPYSVHRVDRSTTFIYDAGQEVYELVAPGGTRWVMQSWSQQIDPMLRRADLGGLGARLHLPAGWRYRTRRLTTPLRIVTVHTAAEVLQDGLDDTYSRVS